MFRSVAIPAAEIAEKLGRSKGAVDARKHKLGLAGVVNYLQKSSDRSPDSQIPTRWLDTRENWQSVRCVARVYLPYFE